MQRPHPISRTGLLTSLIAAVLACSWSGMGAVWGADIVTAKVDYQDQGVKLQGFLARPAPGASQALIPGVLVVHEWWGMNAYAERRATELAKEGYIAFALDMYGTGDQTTDPTQALAWAKPFIADRAAMRRRALAGLAILRSQPGIDPGRIGAMGFCFGGTVVLELARAGEPLAGVVTFHGAIKPTGPSAPGSIKAPILALQGGADPHVPIADLAEFMNEMSVAKADWRLVVYGGAMHAFTNPAAKDPADGLCYDPKAEKASMAEMRRQFRTWFHLDQTGKAP